MSAQFIVRFAGNAMWFQQKFSQGRSVCATADLDHLPTQFISEAEAWLAAREHGLDLKLVTVSAN